VFYLDQDGVDRYQQPLYWGVQDSCKLPLVNCFTFLRTFVPVSFPAFRFFLLSSFFLLDTGILVATYTTTTTAHASLHCQLRLAPDNNPAMVSGD